MSRRSEFPTERETRWGPAVLVGLVLAAVALPLLPRCDDRPRSWKPPPETAPQVVDAPADKTTTTGGIDAAQERRP